MTIRRLLSVAALLGAALGRARASGIQDPGHVLYVRYCGACHGPEGRGDGIAASTSQPKASDLTQLAKRAGGTFPYERTMAIIDGRESVRAHGDAAMPVWGEVLRVDGAASVEQAAEIRGKLALITDYMKSIQE